MPWPWQPLHRVFRAFDHLPPEQARIECARMLDGLRGEIGVDSFLFGGIVTGLIGVFPCAGLFIARVRGSGTGNLFYPLLLVGAVFIGYLAGSWRWQRLAASVIEGGLRPGRDTRWNVCGACRYSLDGLPHDGGRVVCPECGLEQLGADWYGSEAPRVPRVDQRIADDDAGHGERSERES